MPPKSKSTSSTNPKSKRSSPLQRKSTVEPPTPKSSHLKIEDHLVIINWLRNTKNYESCFGTNQSTSVGRPPKSKVNGYQLMALHLKSRSKGRIDLTGKQMMERFKNYRNKYKKAHTMSSSTGFGVTPNDIQRGIRTISEKLNHMCPYYEEMDEIFGHRANVNPLYKEDGRVNVPFSPGVSENNDNQPNQNLDQDLSRSNSSPSASLVPNLVPYLQSSSPSWHPPSEDENRKSGSEVLGDHPSPQIPPATNKNNQHKDKCKQKDLNLDEEALDQSSGPNSPHVFDLENSQTQSKFIKRKPSNSMNVNPRSHSKSIGDLGSVFENFEQYNERRSSVKNELKQQEIQLERVKLERMLRKENRGIELEEKKFKHFIESEGQRWSFEKSEKEKDREEKARDRQFELDKLNLQLQNEERVRRQTFIASCVASGKSTEEIEKLLSFMFPV